MREILFRGQTRKRGEKVRMDGEKLPGKWVYGGVLQGSGDHSIIYGKEAGDTPIDKHAVHSDTLGQYTGLHDKYGERIFEGDIVKQGNRVYVVKWKSENASFELYLDGAEQSGFNTHTAPFLEVIGNIYDNPELLKSSETERK